MITKVLFCVCSVVCQTEGNSKYVIPSRPTVLLVDKGPGWLHELGRWI